MGRVISTIWNDIVAFYISLHLDLLRPETLVRICFGAPLEVSLARLFERKRRLAFWPPSHLKVTGAFRAVLDVGPGTWRCHWQRHVSLHRTVIQHDQLVIPWESSKNFHRLKYSKVQSRDPTIALSHSRSHSFSAGVTLQSPHRGITIVRLHLRSVFERISLYRKIIPRMIFN